MPGRVRGWMPEWRRLARAAIPPVLWVAGLVLIAVGNAVGGVALIAAGMVARVGFRAAGRREVLERLIEGVTVGEVMETVALPVAPQATLDTFAGDLEASDTVTVARVMRDDRLLGVVGARELSRVSRGRWAEVHAGDAMTAATELPALAPDELLGPAAERLGASSASGFPVVVEGRVVGVLTRLGVGRVLHERSAAEAAQGAAGEASPEAGEASPEAGGALSAADAEPGAKRGPA